MYKKLIIIYTVIIAVGVGIAVLMSIEKLGVTGRFNNPLGSLSGKDVVRATWRGHEDAEVHSVVTKACLKMVRKVGIGNILKDAVDQCQCLLFEIKGDIGFDQAKAEYDRMKPVLEWGNHSQKFEITRNNQFTAWFQRENKKVEECFSH